MTFNPRTATVPNRLIALPVVAPSPRIVEVVKILLVSKESLIVGNENLNDHQQNLGELWIAVDYSGLLYSTVQKPHTIHTQNSQPPGSINVLHGLTEEPFHGNP